MKAIRIEIRDLALFIKANLQGLIDDNWNNVTSDIANEINNLIKEISNNKYGYFYWEEEPGDDGYWMPSTAVAIKALQRLFNIKTTQRVLLISPEIFGVYADDLDDFKSPRSNSLRRDRWRNRGKALKSIPLYNRHFPGIIYLD